MTFQVGNPGKPKGATSKIASKFKDTMDKHGFDIAQEMLDLYNEALADHKTELCAKILSEMAQYVYPKLKAIEHTNQDHLKDMSPEQKLEALKQAVTLLESQVKK